MAPGLALLYFARLGRENARSFAIPGSVIAGTGAILFYQNLTGHWESWAYAWTLYPVFIGLGLLYIGTRAGDEQALDRGRAAIRWGALGFLVMAAFFEFIVFDRGGIGSWLLPLALIGAGIFLLNRRTAPATSLGQHSVADTQPRNMDEPLLPLGGGGEISPVPEPAPPPPSWGEGQPGSGSRDSG
jgi:hypothetical protein